MTVRASEADRNVSCVKRDACTLFTVWACFLQGAGEPLKVHCGLQSMLSRCALDQSEDAAT